MRRFRARWRARLLVRTLIDKLSRPAAFKLTDRNISIKADGKITAPVTISIVRRRLRLLDTVRVQYWGLEIWLPLLSRLRLRRAVRCVMAEETQQSLLAPPEDTDDLGS